MNKNDLLFLFHSPYSAWGLRYRATKLKQSPYKNLLLTLADLLDEKKISKGVAILIIQKFREKKLTEGTKMMLDESGLDVETLEHKLLDGVEKP